MWKVSEFEAWELEELLNDQLKKVPMKALRIQWILKIWRMVQTMKSFFLSLRTKLTFLCIYKLQQDWLLQWKACTCACACTHACACASTCACTSSEFQFQIPIPNSNSEFLFRIPIPNFQSVGVCVGVCVKWKTFAQGFLWTCVLCLGLGKPFKNNFIKKIFRNSV